MHKLFHLIANDYIRYAYKTLKESTAYSIEGYYNNHIKDFFYNDFIDEISVRIIKNWQEYMLNKKLAIRTLNKAYTVLCNIFNFAMKEHGTTVNAPKLIGPFIENKEKIVTDEEKIRYITKEQFELFISGVDDILWKTFFSFLFYTGMRKGEVQALTWNDINFETSEIIVNKTLSVKTNKTSKLRINNEEQLLRYKITSTKNNQNRKIKMNKNLCDILSHYKKETMNYCDFANDWFIFGNTRFISQTSIDRYKHLYFQKANLEKEEITIHEFRHSHVSLLINEYIKSSKEKNMKVDTTKFFLMMSNRMGHTIEVMQKTYMHLFPTVQDEIVDLLDNL